MVAPASNNLSSGISKTEFGTELKGMEKLVRFGYMERDSWVKKGAAVVITGVALAALMGPGTAATAAIFIAGKALVASTAVPFIAKVGGVAALIFASIASVGAIVVPGFYFYKAFKRQQAEQKIIQAVGGKKVFDALPVTYFSDPESVEYLSGKPITKGIDRCNRPFITLCTKNSKENEVIIFFQGSSEKEQWAKWTKFNRCSAIMSNDLKTIVKTISKLVKGEEVNGFRLVEA